MSAYITRWCPIHGEWDDDVDKPSECPTCLDEGIAHSQLQAERIAELEAENERLRDEVDRQTKAKECYEERQARKEAENAKLRKCVKAADSEIEAWREWGARIGGDERVCGWVHQEDYGLYCLLSDPPVSDIPYDRARAEVDK